MPLKIDLDTCNSCGLYDEYCPGGDVWKTWSKDSKHTAHTPSDDQPMVSP